MTSAPGTRSKPAITRNSEDLPQPDRPNRAVTPSSGMSRETSSTKLPLGQRTRTCREEGRAAPTVAASDAISACLLLPPCLLLCPCPLLCPCSLLIAAPHESDDSYRIPRTGPEMRRAALTATAGAQQRNSLIQRAHIPEWTAPWFRREYCLPTSKSRQTRPMCERRSRWQPLQIRLDTAAE